LPRLHRGVNEIHGECGGVRHQVAAVLLLRDAVRAQR
jgi:hypothetical protein